MNRSFDWTLAICAIILSIIGIMLIYSASPASNLWVKQTVYLALGIVVMIALWRIPLKVHYSFGWIYFFIAVILLIAPLFQAGEIRRWLHLGIFTFQPSELAKPAVALVLARFLYDRKKEIRSIKTIALAAIVIIIPFVIVMSQPDLGTAMVFIAIFVASIYVAGIDELTLFFLASPLLSIALSFHWISWAIFFVALLVILWFSRTRLVNFLIISLGNLFIGVMTPAIWRNIHEYQKQRILVFLDPGRDPFGAGYQIIQSKIAVGSGQFWGKGFLEGTQTKLAFLPARHTDFIFAVLGEQFGFVGTLLVLLLFFILFYRILKIADEARNNYARLTAVGLGTVLFFGVIVNIGMAIGLMPVTGLPLPFFSAGGSNLITTFGIIGILLNIHSHGVEGP
ncbi:MAG TPA: rod shape-determining protein RodA [candidate division Zixibacteria bacterium]|nr:rod shape-determining protein RodA [candidate division Zixibacteria bacterium]